MMKEGIEKEIEELEAMKQKVMECPSEKREEMLARVEKMLARLKKMQANMEKLEKPKASA